MTAIGLAQREVTYAGGADAIIAHWEERRSPIKTQPLEGFPELDVDLAALNQQRVPLQLPELVKPATEFARKRHGLAQSLGGQTNLVLMNALVIAHLRKRSFPDHAPSLFRRIWAEQSAALLQEMPLRWVISSVITFADHGPTEADRRVGQSLNVLVSLMKLYEFERQFSGTDSRTAYNLADRHREALPLGMPDFSIASGGLDINLLAPIWKAARDAEAIAPLACHLLKALNEDPGNLFRRLNLMRDARRKQLVVKKAKT